MSVKRIKVFTCDRCGRTGEVDVDADPGVVVTLPAGWTTDAKGDVCDRHPIEWPTTLLLKHDGRGGVVRASNPGWIPLLAATREGNAWTLVVPENQIEVEP